MSENNARFWTGRRMPKEIREKMSFSQKNSYNKGRFERGAVPWNKGKRGVYSREHLEELSKSKQGKNNPWYGKCLPLEMRKKIAEALRGERAYNWKGGVTPLLKLVRRCYKYREWSKSILRRDNYTCQICGRYGGRLEVDHCPVGFTKLYHHHSIESMDGALKCGALWDTNNGRTLCMRCHNKTKRGR